MAESTLGLLYGELLNEIALFLGWGWESDPFATTLLKWSGDQFTQIQNIAKRGLRQFYWPPPVGGNPTHRWRFLRPTGFISAWADMTVTGCTGVYALPSTEIHKVVGGDAAFYSGMTGHVVTVDSTNEYVITAVATDLKSIFVAGDKSFSNKTIVVRSDGWFSLPDNFGHLIGNLTFAPDIGYPAIRIAGEGRIRDLRSRNDNSGVPQWGSIVPLAFDEHVGQRFQLILYPTPDADYTLYYRYAINPENLTLHTAGTASPHYCYGGAGHSETIIESCLSIAEARMNDNAGIHQALFLQRLEASIALDVVQGEPDLYGANLDKSDGPKEIVSRVTGITYTSPITGVTYTGDES